MGENRLKYGIPGLLVVALSAAHFWFEEWASHLMGDAFPFGWLALIFGAFILGLAYNDLKPAVISWYNQLGVYFDVGDNAAPRPIQYTLDNDSQEVAVFDVQNKSSKHISNVEIFATVFETPIYSVPNFSGPAKRIPLHFQDQSNQLNPQDHKSSALFHRNLTKKTANFGSPENPFSALLPGFNYTGFISITGHNSRPKKIPFDIDVVGPEIPKVFIKVFQTKENIS